MRMNICFPIEVLPGELGQLTQLSPSRGDEATPVLTMAIKPHLAQLRRTLHAVVFFSSTSFLGSGFVQWGQGRSDGFLGNKNP